MTHTTHTLFNNTETDLVQWSAGKIDSAVDANKHTQLFFVFFCRQEHRRGRSGVAVQEVGGPATAFYVDGRPQPLRGMLHIFLRSCSGWFLFLEERLQLVATGTLNPCEACNVSF